MLSRKLDWHQLDPLSIGGGGAVDGGIVGAVSGVVAGGAAVVVGADVTGTGVVAGCVPSLVGAELDGGSVDSPELEPGSATGLVVATGSARVVVAFRGAEDWGASVGAGVMGTVEEGRMVDDGSVMVIGIVGCPASSSNSARLGCEREIVVAGSADPDKLNGSGADTEGAIDSSVGSPAAVSVVDELAAAPIPKVVPT